ncbi:hypothetical protein [Bacillus altitudinis]|uniref:hypothetical protein n=1 Tax=Bacillus altitudinis TaxID=293387 RepID=UPI0011A51E3F|nr:hypothetical protein [Bacillus altitudinis]
MGVIKGRKREKEKLGGGGLRYRVESVMDEGKAVESGSSDFLGKGFGKGFGIEFLNGEGKLEDVEER